MPVLRVCVTSRSVTRAVRESAVLGALVLTTEARAQGAPQPPVGPPPAVTLTVRVEAQGGPLEDARVRAGSVAALSNAVGVALLRLPAGTATVVVTRLGFHPESLTVALRAGRDTAVTVTMAETAESLTSVVVTTARGASRIEDAPTRVEVLAGEDVAEKMEMRPADATGFLSEMGGVRVQRTAAGSGAAGVRLQGLRPRYTLMLNDGLPVYGGGGSGLDLLQLPPADLRQVEVIKGPATALYGPAALGGVINLVSKRPGHERDLLVQQSSRGGTNAYGWYSQRFSPAVGLTLLAGAHGQSRQDLNADGWADMPGFERVEARPRLFLEGAHGGSLLVTAGGTRETRRGGFLPGRLAPDGLAYAEQVDTRRADVGVMGHRMLGERMLLQLRGAANRDQQDRQFGEDPESLRRSTGFGELSLSRQQGAHDALVGVSAQADRNQVRQQPALNYHWTTASAFAQDVWTLAPALALTGSARVDQHSRFGTLVSPRLSARYLLTPGLTARVAWAGGQSAPTPYVEETQAVGVRRVRNFGAIRPERADYASADLTGSRGPFQLIATAFTSRIRDAVTATPGVGAAAGTLQVANALAPVRTRGAELFLETSLRDFYGTVIYSYTDAREPATGSGAASPAPYMPRHAGGIDLTFESEETGSWIAVEAFYTGPQPTAGDPYRASGKPYTVVGVLVAQQVGPVRLFCSMENLTDARQSRIAPVVLPSRALDGRWTTAPWGLLEGRVISLGVRWSAQGKPHGLTAP